MTAVDIVGIATDHCVRATALDAARAGFATTVLLDLCAGVAPDTTERALAEMTAAGVTLRDLSGNECLARVTLTGQARRANAASRWPRSGSSSGDRPPVASASPTQRGPSNRPQA